jgi:hypothetical protein
MIFVFSQNLAKHYCQPSRRRYRPDTTAKQTVQCARITLAAAEYKLFLAIIFHRFVIHP